MTTAAAERRYHLKALRLFFWNLIVPVTASPRVQRPEIRFLRRHHAAEKRSRMSVLIPDRPRSPTGRKINAPGSVTVNPSFCIRQSRTLGSTLPHHYPMVVALLRPSIRAHPLAPLRKCGPPSSAVQGWQQPLVAVAVILR